MEDRPDLRQSTDHPLILALRDLLERHGLTGAVLISFDGDSGRVGVNSSGATDEFGAAMERLGDQLLTAIADGQFDPVTP
jgi:hypothetical protein